MITPSPPTLAPTGGPARINEPAPDFTARSTLGEIRLSAYQGRWVILFSHPADFTPVCTSEFVALQRAFPRFQALGCDLIGLSVDSLYAHIAWVLDIKARFGVEIAFPILEDISMAVSRAFGMIHEGSADTAAVRSAFFIDPQGIVRAIIHYPMNVGRSVEEMLRVAAALQAAHTGRLSTPEGWRPGEAGVLPPPLDQHEAAARAGAAWYFTPADQAS
jgi:peroxiredoxin (alkyl hydroperoxide reductase subunit C)